MTQSAFTFKQSTITEILLVPKSDNIQSMSPEFSDEIQPSSLESDQPRFRQPNEMDGIWQERQAG